MPVAVMVDSLARPGGGERLAVDGIAGLDPARWKRHFVITRWDAAAHRGPGPDELLERLDEAGIEVLRLERHSKADLAAWRPLLRLLRSRRIQILHSHLFGSNVWGSTLGTLMRTPVVISHEHTWAYDSARGVRPFLDRNLIARFSDAFVAVSRQDVRGMLEVERIPQEKIRFVPNGVRSLGDGDRGAVREEFGIPAGTPLLVSVGHLRAQKSFGTLVRALAVLRKTHPEARALIAGEGPEREVIERLVAELGLEEAMLLPGARRDIADVLAAGDVAVCSSDFEGWPLSVMEYMGAGLPVVATRVGGIPELIQDGVTGRLVPAGDPQALAGAVAEMLDDREAAATRGAAGKTLIAAEYGLDVWVRRLETLYDRLLVQTGTRRSY